jgi:1,2-diacylglycerol 3-alpha-glucosyltransferase
MRIAIISSYPPIECGIGAYTAFLVDALRQTPTEVHVISQHGAEGLHVHPVYSTSDVGIAEKIFEMTSKVTPELVHIQHAFPLYGETEGIAILELVYRLKAAGTPVLATFHTVRRDFTLPQALIMRVLCRELDGVIVHEEDHVEILKSTCGADPARIMVIPHGARRVEPISDAKEKLGLTGKKVVMLAGYLRPAKCFDRIVDIFPSVIEKVPDAYLVIAAKLRLLEYGEYRRRLYEKINHSSVRSRIEVFRGQFPELTFETIVSASEVMAFPYEVGAQSGMMAHALSYGKPVVCSPLPAFENLIHKSDAGFVCDTDVEYVDRITALLTNPELYAEKSRNALKYVRDHIAWDIVADQTRSVYNQFDVKLECRTRHVYVG